MFKIFKKKVKQQKKDELFNISIDKLMKKLDEDIARTEEHQKLLNYQIREEMEYRIRNLIRGSRLIFQDRNTVLRYNGETYVAKPEKKERFDAEKGLMVCFLKALGIKPSDIIKKLENAEHYGSKVVAKNGRKGK